METPIYRAAYRWTSEELETAMRRHMQSEIKTSVAWSVSLVLAIGAALSLLLMMQDLPGTSPELFLIVPGVALFWSAPLLVNWHALFKARRDFDKQPGADQLIEFEISAREVKHWQREFSYSAVAWKSFVKVAEFEDGFLLYRHPSIFHWLPFRAFETPDAPERVRELIQASGVPYKKIAS